MQVGLFEMVNDVVVPGETTLSIPVFLEIKKQFPKDYLKVFQYIFFMTCWDARNIFLNVSEEDRPFEIVQALELEVSLDEPIIEKAIELAIKLYETPAVAAFKAAKNMVHKVSKFLNDTTPTSGKFSNVPDIDKFMTKLPEYTSIYAKIGEQLKEEQSKIRGNRKIAYDQEYQLKKDGSTK